MRHRWKKRTSYFTFKTKEEADSGFAALQYAVEAQRERNSRVRLASTIRAIELSGTVLGDLDSGIKCPICYMVFSESDKPVADHDHKSGLGRSLLCGKCNSGIGFFRDDILSIRRAALYIGAWKAKHKNHVRNAADPLRAES